MAAVGTENMMMNGSFSDSVLRGHDRVDEHQRQQQHRAQLIECLGLLLDLGAEADRKVLGKKPEQLRQLGVDGIDRLAQVRFGVGADIRDTLLVLPLNLRWANRVGHSHQILRLNDGALRRADEDVTDIADRLPLVFPEANDDGIFLATLTKQRSLRAGNVRPQRVRHRRAAHTEQCRLGTIDFNRQLRTAIVATEPGIGHVRYGVEHVLRRLRHLARIVQVVAADFE